MGVAQKSCCYCMLDFYKGFQESKLQDIYYYKDSQSTSPYSAMDLALSSLILVTTCFAAVSAQQQAESTCNACNCWINNIEVLTQLIKTEIAIARQMNPLQVYKLLLLLLCVMSLQLIIHPCTEMSPDS